MPTFSSSAAPHAGGHSTSSRSSASGAMAALSGSGSAAAAGGDRSRAGTRGSEEDPEHRGGQGSSSGQVGPSGSVGSGRQAAQGPSLSLGGEVPERMSNYAFFVKYTYSNECALLAYNFHELVTKLGIFEQFAYRHDHRLISVTLAYIFYRYQVHHCDMALDLAVTLVYLEDVRVPGQPELQENSRDAFHLICYLAFLAHAFNADRTIRLSDWYKEIGWRSFRNCQQLNGYVFFLFSQVRRFRLRVSEARVKRYIQKLCSVPSQIHTET
mmetsp:Transcript_120204/g.347376  ORF Transcript_120204/g.347376 Transcript_120204/m.347376 type:complete len:269 (+) Transcript_120204:161-967(+)